MSTDKDPWHKGYASDYFSSDEDDEVDTSHRRTILSAEAKLKKDLDFNSRYDPAIFKETPFTHATINAARNLRSDSDNPPSQARPGPSSNTAVDSTYTGSPWKVKNGSSASTSTKSKALTQAASRPVPGRNIPVSNPDPGGRMDATKLAVQQEESKKEEMKKKEQVKAKKKDWSTNSGWKEKGKPVPATKTKKAADDQTRSVVDQVTDAITLKPNTGRAKKTATAAKKDGPAVEAGPTTSKKGAAKPRVAKGKGKVKGVKQDQEKITFTRIPATPSSSFPIVQGLNKLREKPLRPSTKAASSKRLISDTISDSSEDQSISALLGIATQAETELKRQKPQKESRVRPVLPPSSPPSFEAVQVDNVGAETQGEGMAIGSDIGNFTSEEEDGTLDPEARCRKEALSRLRESLARGNVVYQQQKAFEPLAPPPSLARAQTPDARHADHTAFDPEPEAYDSHPRRACPPGVSPHDLYNIAGSAGNNRYWRQEPPSTRPAPYSVPFDSLPPPTTMTHVPIPQLSSKYFPPVPPSSSSQLPYSSPLQRHVYGDTYMPRDYMPQPVTTPSPRRLHDYGHENIDYLENMVEEADHTWHTQAESRKIASLQYNHGQRRDYHDRGEVEGENNHVTQVPDRGNWRGNEYQESLPKRRYDGENPQQHTRKPIKRTRASAPLRDDGEDVSNDQGWSTLKTPKASKQRNNNDQTETPKFRLPSNFFALQQSQSSGLKINPAASSSSQSARASWFRPSGPGNAVEAKTDGYSTVTSRGVQAARKKNNNNLKNKPTFVTDARNARSSHQDFHDQLKDSIGITGQAKSVFREMQNYVATHEAAQNQDEQDDWRAAWRTAAKSGTQPSNALSQYTYHGGAGRDGTEFHL